MNKGGNNKYMKRDSQEKSERLIEAIKSEKIGGMILAPNEVLGTQTKQVREEALLSIEKEVVEEGRAENLFEGAKKFQIEAPQAELIQQYFESKLINQHKSGMGMDLLNQEVIEDFELFSELIRNIQYMQGGPEASQIKGYLDLAFLVDRFYRGSDGARWTRRFEMSKKNHRERRKALVISHSLKITNISLGLIDKLHERGFLQAEYEKKIKKKAPFLALLHDLFEAEKERYKKDDKPEIAIEDIIKILSESGLNDIEIVEIFTMNSYLNFKRDDIQQEDGSFQQKTEKYTQIIEQNFIAHLMKISDILQNAFSPHTDKQREKYEKHYIPLLKSFCQRVKAEELTELIPSRFFDKMLQANPYLEAIFKNQGIAIPVE